MPFSFKGSSAVNSTKQYGDLGSHFDIGGISDGDDAGPGFSLGRNETLVLIAVALVIALVVIRKR